MGFRQKAKLPKNSRAMTKIFGATARITNAGMNRPGVKKPKDAISHTPFGWGKKKKGGRK